VRVLRVLLVMLAALVALAAVALWQVPRFLDWNNYREDITRLAATVLDRPVLIDGPISLRLLPQPTLTASDVRIAGEPDEGTLSARELSFGVGLAPLLAGRVDARELVLRGVDIQVPWPLPDNALPIRRPGWLAGLSASIEDGRLTVGKIEVSAISATLTVGGPTGGYQLAGMALVDGRPWRVTARLGPAGADNTSPLDLTIAGGGRLQGMEATFSGQISPDGAGGRMTAKGPDLAQLLPAPKVPFSADGRLTVAAGLAAADDLALVIGDAPAHGAVSLRVAPSLRVDVAIAATRLDLDAWLPVLLQTRELPCPVGLDLSAEAAQATGGLVRRLRAAFELDAGKVEIREASAILPGEANVRLSGRITRPAPERPHFEGAVAVVAPDLRGTLQWLDPPDLKSLDVLPTALRSLNLSGQATVEPDRLALTGLAGTLDDSRVGGSVILGLGGHRQLTTVRADLQLDRLELDAWLPAALPPLGDIAKLPATMEADLRVRVAQARLRGVAISGLVVDGAAAERRLSIRRLEGTALGVQASVSGTVDPSGRVAGGKLTLATQDATPLADWLPSAARATPTLWHSPLRVEAQADGPPGALNLRIHVALADSDLTVTSKLNLPARGGTGSISLHNPGSRRLLQAAGFGAFATWLGDGPLGIQARLDVAPDRIGVDGLDLAAGLLRAGGQFALDTSGEQPRLLGQLTADAVPLPRIDVRAPDPLPLDLLRGWQATVQMTAKQLTTGSAGATRPIVQQASGTWNLAGGKLRLEDWAAKLAGGTLAGSASLDAASEPPTLAVQATLRDATIAGPVTGLPIDIVAGHAEGDLKLTATGHSPAAMLATLDGGIRVAVRDGTLVGFDLAALDTALGSAPREGTIDAALTSALATGRTGFSRLDLTANAARGVLDIGGTTFTGPGGGAVFSGSLDLPGSALDLHAAIHPALPDAPEIGLRITGRADAPKHLPELADVTRWLVQHTHTQ
jgi:AsmA-like protein